MAKETEIDLVKQIEVDDVENTTLLPEEQIDLTHSTTDVVEEPEEPEKKPKEKPVKKLKDKRIEVSEEEIGKTKIIDKGEKLVNEGEKSPVSPYAAMLHEQGVLPNLKLEEFDKLETDEDKITALINAQREEIEGGIVSWIETLPEQFKYALTHYKDGMSIEQILDIDSKRYSLPKLTDEQLSEDEELQEQIYRLDLQNKGLEAKRIDRLVKTSKEEKTLFEDSKEAYDTLKKNASEYEKTQKIQHDKELQSRLSNEKKLKETLKKTLTETKEIIPGIPFNQKIQEEVFQSMMTFDEDGMNEIMRKRNEDPMKFEIRANYLLKLGAFDDDWSKIIKSTEASATKKFMDKISINPKLGTGASQKSSSGTNTEDLLRSLKKQF